jgi:hypothetical protein
MGNSLSHEKRIFNLLAASWPSEVPALSLSRISLQYSSRIFALRRKGWTITNRIEIRNGTKYGFFRLVEPPIARSRELRENRLAMAEMPKPQLAETENLFDLSPLPD